MPTQNPCLFTLAFPDQGGEPASRRVWILPFGYDAEGVDETQPEQTEDASLKAAARAKPALSELLSKAAVLALQEPTLPTPVAVALERVRDGLALSLDWFGFDSAMSELGPGWARASARGLGGMQTGAAEAALALCVNKMGELGAPIRAAKAAPALLDFCEERTDDVPGSFLRGLTAHSLELFAKGYSLSGEAPAAHARRPVACFMISAPDGPDGSPGERGAIFWPAPDESDRTARMKQSLQLVKATLDAKRRLEGPALEALTEVGSMFGGGEASLERSRVDAPFAAPGRVERVEINNAILSNAISPEHFAEAFRALAREMARQLGPACALGGESAKALAHSLASGSLEPEEWSGVSRLMARVFDASPAAAPASSPKSPSEQTLATRAPSV